MDVRHAGMWNVVDDPSQDLTAITDAAAAYLAEVPTVEEGAIGGFAAHVLQFLATDGLLDNGLKIRPMTLPDRFIAHGTPQGMYEDAGLTVADIVNTALATLGSNSAMADLRA